MCFSEKFNLKASLLLILLKIDVSCRSIQYTYIYGITCKMTNRVVFTLFLHCVNDYDNILMDYTGNLFYGTQGKE